MKLKMVILIVVLMASLMGCAGLSFYKQENMKGEKVGLKGYYSKPYILVAREGITNKVTSVSIIYLPDLEHPVYAKAKSGYGSSILSLGFANGIISSFGQQTDTKIPESITSLGGFGGAVATATKTFAEAAVLQKQSGDFGKFADIILHVIGDLKAISQESFTGNEKRILDDTIKALVLLEKKFKEPGAIAKSCILVEELEKAIEIFSGMVPPADNLLTEPIKAVWGKIAKNKNELNMILDELKPKKSELPAFSLYEIIMQGNKSSFKEVFLDKL